MYCRNCGNDVSDKAVACPKCGFNPNSEKKFCPNCGVGTNENQIICTECGVSLEKQSLSFDMSALQKFDVNSFTKNKASVAAAVALLGCFLPWVKINMFVMVQSLNFFGMTKIAEVAPNSILYSFILYLFPLSLLGFIASDYVPQISKYKNYFSLATVAIMAYILLGMYLAMHPSTPEMPEGSEQMGQMMNGMMAKAAEAAQDMITIGIGFYISLLATIASFVFFRMKK